VSETERDHSFMKEITQLTNKKMKSYPCKLVCK